MWHNYAFIDAPFLRGIFAFFVQKLLLAANNMYNLC